MASTLAPYELFKYSWRVDKFLEKYQKGDSFELCNGAYTNLVYNPELEEIIRKEKRSELIKSIFTDLNGNKISLSDLKKTHEFGGKVKGFSTRVENMEIHSINNQLNEIKSQTLQLSIPLKISDNVYTISVCSKINGTPKADFKLSNDDNTENVWISHKKGKNPTHFQQWSGMTEYPISTHSETIHFISDTQSKFNSGLIPTKNYSRTIDDPILKNQTVYGIDYNKKPFGNQNVTIVAQGEIRFIRSDNYFSLESNMMHHNGESMINEYEPVFSVTYRTDRNQFGIKNARFFVLPKGGRKISAYI